MQRLLFFGDSWPHGDDLNNGEQPFPHLVSEKLHCFYHNYSQSSTSIPHLVNQLRYAVDHSRNTGELSYAIDDGTCSAVFFLTSPLRDLVFTDSNWRDLHPHRPEDYEWYAKYSSNELHSYRTNTTILALQKICEIYNLNSFFIWGWEKVELWPEVNIQHFYPQSCAEMFDSNFTNFTNLKNSKNKYIWPNVGHPNQLGHQLIADNLSKFIQEKLTTI